MFVCLFVFYSNLLNSHFYFYSFKVYYSMGDFLNLESVSILEVKGTEGGVTLSGLTPNTSYSLRVEAYTETNRVLEVAEVHTATLPGLKFSCYS